MTNEEYLKSLNGTVVKSLKETYLKVFGVPAPSKLKKADLVKELHEKFCAINTAPEAEETEGVQETPEVEAEVEKEKPASRRATIIAAIKEHLWDRNTLAEWLHELNPEWPVAKNKAAISGTLADLRANKGWTCKIGDDGRISVDIPA